MNSNTCGNEQASPNVTLGIQVLFIVIIPLAVVYYYRDVPDSIGIKQESIRAFAMLIFIAVLYLVMAIGVRNPANDEIIIFSWVSIFKQLIIRAKQYVRVLSLILDVLFLC